MSKNYDFKSQPLEGGEYRSVTDVYRFQLERGKIKTVKEINNTSVSVEYTAINVGKNKLTTFLGSTTESKYGYAADFDLVSRDYIKSIATHNYTTAEDLDVVTSMDDKYQSIKKDIEDNYLGDEKNSRLLELDKNYKFIMDSNVVQSTDVALKNESAINKLKLTCANAYENAINKKNSEFVETEYGNISGWKTACEEIGSQLESYKAKFEKFKVDLYDTDNKEGAAEYANSLLKTINAGLAGVKEKHVAVGEKISASREDRVKELWSLIETKANATYLSDNTYASDLEKYQGFLKNSLPASGVDKRLKAILNDFIPGDI
jgi:hypothetical protein